MGLLFLVEILLPLQVQSNSNNEGNVSIFWPLPSPHSLQNPGTSLPPPMPKKSSSSTDPIITVLEHTLQAASMLLSSSAAGLAPPLTGSIQALFARFQDQIPCVALPRSRPPTRPPITQPLSLYFAQISSMQYL